jgi:hypothetical protein
VEREARPLRELRVNGGPERIVGDVELVLVELHVRHHRQRK